MDCGPFVVIVITNGLIRGILWLVIAVILKQIGILVSGLRVEGNYPHKWEQSLATLHRILTI